MLGKVSEFILAYARNGEALRRSGVGKIELTGKFSNPDNDPRGPWSSKPWKVGSGQSGSNYTVTTPSGSTYTEAWMGERKTFDSLLADGRIVFPSGGSGPPRKKYFQSERAAEGQAATTWWSHDDVGHNQEASQEVADLFGSKQVFDNPKPVRLLRNLIRVGDASGDGIVLDFFAGSGTTAHAVLDSNDRDSRSRRFILVQLPEPLSTGDSEQTSGAVMCDLLGVPRNIAELTKERVRRAIAKLNEEEGEANGQDRGFRVFKLAESSFNVWDAQPSRQLAAFEEQLRLHVDNVRDERSADDVLFELLLKSGYPLSATIESLELDGKRVFSVADGALLVCLDRGLSLELMRVVAERKPERFVVLDEGFAANDQLKANAVQIFKAAGVTFRTV
jgi:adenine-specific DNA-methyltransferase